MPTIHPTAIVENGAQIADSVEIGPYCIVGPDVALAEGVVLHAHVVIGGRTRVGPKTQIYSFASIGQPPQDLKYKGEPSELIIGANNVIREYATMHPGTAHGGMVTRIGSNGLFMVGAHVAHDCTVGDHVVMANNASLAGHVEVGDYAIFGGLSAVHQFVRIGRHAMIGGLSAVVSDVIPYGSVTGDRARLSGLNIVGLKRRGFSRDDIHHLRTAYRLLFAQEGTMGERIADVSDMYTEHTAIMEIVDFINSDSSRAVCQPRAEHAA